MLCRLAWIVDEGAGSLFEFPHVLGDNIDWNECCNLLLIAAKSLAAELAAVAALAAASFITIDTGFAFAFLFGLGG